MFKLPSAALALAALAFLPSASAQPTAAPGFALQTAYVHSTAAEIFSYDWGSSSSLHYMTSLNFDGMDIWRASAGAPTNIYRTNDFAGASVVSVGSYVYFNDGNSNIYRYDPLAPTPAVLATSSATNYALFGYQGDLFLTGSTPNHIYFGDLDASGALPIGAVRDLGAAGMGFSGPLTFDLAGNLYYAPGASDRSIYKFSRAEMMAALNNPSTPLPTTGHKWLDYSGAGLTEGGATSMLIGADGDLLVTLTEYLKPSYLYEFGVAGDGSYDTTATMILSEQSTARLGELRLRDGQVYISDGNAIYKVVPEPATGVMLLLGLAGFAWRRTRQTVGVSMALGVLALGASAGPYSSAEKNDAALNPNAPDAGIAGFVGPAGEGVVRTSSNGNSVNPLFVEWASKVINYSPSAGVEPNYAMPLKALGPVTGDPFSTVSLGDLPKATGGTRPAAGSLTLGFDLPLYNGPGADFATFENGLISLGESGVRGQLFGELAYLEVSSDGSNYARFPSISLTAKAVDTYGTIDPTNVYNLVGKHANAGGVSWGTPFDLESLANDLLVRSGTVSLQNIRFIRIVDVPGDGTFFDSVGNPIYDPWQTSISGGLDLEALGVIYQIPEPGAGGWMVVGLGAFCSRIRPAA